MEILYMFSGVWWIIWLACGIACAVIAGSRNRSVLGWLVLGFLLGPVALLTVGFLGARIAPQSVRKCPFCAEMVLRDAKVCKHCGRELPPLEGPKRRCPHCGEAMPADQMKCPACGKKSMEYEGERL